MMTVYLVTAKHQLYINNAVVIASSRPFRADVLSQILFIRIVCCLFAPVNLLHRAVGLCIKCI